MSLTVRAQPNARTTAVDGVVDGVLRVRVAAPPVEGAANEALCRYFAKSVFHVAPGRVQVAKGATGRAKRIDVAGLSLAEAELALTAAGV